jgi:tRNA (adenine22-N1)-methyltransferase
MVINLKLSKRLETLISIIPKSSLVVDVGTDHALVPIEIINRNIANKVIASDVKIGPLEVAKKNINKYKLNNYIDIRLSDGLENIKACELETLIISGIGGILTSRLLEKNLDKARKIKKLILLPMNSNDIIRKWLYENGFNIYDEVLVKEDRRIYSIMSVNYDGKARNYDEIYYYVGKSLILKKDKYFYDYLDRILYINNKKLNSINKSKRNLDKFNNIKNLIEKIDSLKNGEKIL